MSKRNNIEEIYDFVSEKVDHYPRLISSMVRDKFGLTRQGATYHLNQMIKKEMLTSSGDRRSKRYFEKPISLSTNCYELEDEPEEHQVWNKIEESIIPQVNENVSYILFYGFTEMFNNAKDHSEGTQICVGVSVFRSRIKIRIADDGIGIFKKIKEAENLDNEQQSILVLSKGKFTTDPENHTGEGIFFTSRAFDFFDIASNDLCFIHERENCHDMLDEIVYDQGTTVVMELGLNSNTDMTELFDRFTSDPEDPSFSQTIVPIKRLGSKNGQVVSRSQGKRVMAGLEKFAIIVLDFEEVSLIGQGFADEVFRVWNRKKPLIKLQYINANPKVEKMILHVLKLTQN